MATTCVVGQLVSSDVLCGCVEFTLSPPTLCFLRARPVISLFQFILTSAMTGSKPLDEITVREAKHLLARLCMQRFLPPSAVNSNSDVKDAHTALFLRLGTRDLDDHERFWDMGLEFGERILIVVMGEICDETAAHRD